MDTEIPANWVEHGDDISIISNLTEQNDSSVMWFDVVHGESYSELAAQIYMKLSGHVDFVTQSHLAEFVLKVIFRRKSLFCTPHKGSSRAPRLSQSGQFRHWSISSLEVDYSTKNHCVWAVERHVSVEICVCPLLNGSPGAFGLSRIGQYGHCSISRLEVDYSW